MKQRFVFVFVLMAAMVVSTAYAQNGGMSGEETLSEPVAVARCAYTSGDGCQVQDPDDREVELAQMPRRMPPPHPRGRPMGYPPRYGYPGFGTGGGHPGHALIGAVLLGGLGGSLAYNTHPNGQTGPNVVGGLFAGGLGAVVGWIIGNHIPWEHSSRFRRRSWPDEDETASNRVSVGPLSASH